MAEVRLYTVRRGCAEYDEMRRDFLGGSFSLGMRYMYGNVPFRKGPKRLRFSLS